jgi:hypothetical protein
MPLTSFRVLPGRARAPASAPVDADDVALVLALRRGDAGAELEAWNRFSPRVDGTLRRMRGPAGERDDLLQEVFIRFFRRVGTLREPSAVRGFLTGICLRIVQGEIAGVPTPDPAGPGCTVVDRWADDSGGRMATRLPACAGAGGATPCWMLVDDAATCGAGAQRLQVDRGSNAVPTSLVTAIDCTAPHE